MTSRGSWSYGIKAEVLQNAAQGNRDLRFLILSAIQQVKTNKGLNKSLASDGSAAGAPFDVIRLYFFPFFRLNT